MAYCWTAIAVACRDSDIRNVRALIVGPPDTPYEFGFFEVTDRPGKSKSLSVLADGFGSVYGQISFRSFLRLDTQIVVS